MKKAFRLGLCVFAAVMLLVVCYAAGAEAPAVKKLVADVKEIVLYANQAAPAAITISAEPEGASLEGITLSVKKEGVITAEAEENVIRVSPVSAGTTALTVEAGKAKLNLSVKVLVPVESVTLSRKDEVVPRKKIRFSSVVEPKNAGNKNVEWFLEGSDLATIDQNGVLSVSADCPPGAKLTVRCRALGSGIPVETAEEIDVGLPLSQQERKGYEQLKALPLPGPLQQVTADGRSWHEDFGLPEVAKFSTVLLENNYLYVETDRDVAHISIDEYTADWNSVAYMITERREKNKAGLQLVNPQQNLVIVTVFEDLEVNGKKQENYSQSYTLCLEPLSLTAKAQQNCSDADGEAWAPYQKKNKKDIRLQAYILPDGLTTYVHYYFEDKAGTLGMSANFDNEGMFTDASVSRSSASGNVYSSVMTDSTGEGYFYRLGSESYGFDMKRINYDPAEKTSHYYDQKYPGKDLSDPAVHIWILDLIISHSGTNEVFATTEDLFVHMEDGTVQMNTGIEDLNGKPFPWPYLADLISPDTFAYPCITAAGE